MALSDQEKERITEEEKLRMDVRQQMLGGCCGAGRWRRHCCGWRGGVIKLVILAVVLGAIFWHPWHHCRNDGYGPRPPAAESTPKS